MSLHAFSYGANVVSYDYKGHKMAMTCAWATQISYGDIVMLLGAQSDTARSLKVGDRCGVSALSKGQEDIALQLGDGHSLTEDKFKGIQYENDHGVITILGAKVKMKCTVTKIEDIDGDNLVFFHVDSYIEDPDKEYLVYSTLNY